MVVSLVHLSDPHVRSAHEGQGGPDSAARLKSAIASVENLADPNVPIVITGDLVHRGSVEAYDTFWECINRFKRKIYVVPGNHDVRRRIAVQRAQERQTIFNLHQRVVSRVELREFDLLLLDSLEEGAEYGRLGSEQLMWVRDQLRNRPGRKHVIALHHPPVVTGLPEIDDSLLRDATDLEQLVCNHSNVVLLLAGHVHRPVFTLFGGTNLVVAPSIDSTHSGGLRAGSVEHETEPLGLAVLHCIFRDRVASHLVPF